MTGRNPQKNDPAENIANTGRNIFFKPLMPASIPKISRHPVTTRR